MKQHITIEQFNELSKKGKRAYLDYCIKKGMYTEKSKELTESGMTVNSTIPLLSIGQMIEFLHSEGNLESIDDADYVADLDFEDEIGTQFQVTLRDFPGIGERDGIYAYELCDALWEATKKVLESD